MSNSTYYFYLQHHELYAAVKVLSLPCSGIEVHSFIAVSAVLKFIKMGNVNCIYFPLELSSVREGVNTFFDAILGLLLYKL